MTIAPEAPENVVDLIYESAFVPETWPAVLDQVSAMTGSIGGALLATGERHPPRWAASESIAPALRAYVLGEGWKENKRPQEVLSNGGSGFSRDIDLWTSEEIERYRISDQRSQHGLGWQIGSIIPMLTGETVIFTFDRRFDDGPHEVAMRDAADLLRPHLARAGMLAARLGLERARTAVATLEAIGLPAAVTSHTGRVLANNGLLDRGQILLPAAGGEMALHNMSADMLRHAISTTATGLSRSRSIPLAATPDRPAAVIHVLPLSGAAHDIFFGAAVMVVITSIGMSTNTPDLHLLRGLFDLSPAEAKLAAALSSGLTLRQAAEDAGVRISTARSYMESIFRKTDTHQQSQLVALLKSTQPLGQDRNVPG